MRKYIKRMVSMGLVIAMLTSSMTVFAETTGSLSTETTPEATTPEATTPEATTPEATTPDAGTTAPTDAADDNVVIKENDKPYLALGADLSEEQKATVLNLMGIDSAQLGNYDVVTVTNAEEHQYLDAYISSSQIGSKSWSSVVIVKKDAGNGINISTKNINYCTVGMYKNALVTAGIKDADIIVAGPQNISGTAALVGVFKAYQEITGNAISEDSVDTALNELVLTGKLESSTGADADTVEGMIAYLKQKIVENGLDDENSISEAIDEAVKEFDVTLSEDEKQQLIDLLMKISDLDLDVDSLVNQAKSIYDKIADMDIDTDGIFAQIGDFFSNFFSSIVDFFKNLFS